MNSLRVLLTDGIDYAGIFPPANLSLDEAATRYARYRQSAESWMLGRFVCPTRRLSELNTAGEFRWRIAAAGPASESAEAFSRELNHACEQIIAVRDRHGEQARVELLEVPLTKQVATDADSTRVEDLLRAAADRILHTPLDLSAVLFESAFGEQSAQRLPMMAAVLAAMNQRRQAAPNNKPLFGLKLRTSAAAGVPCPNSEQVALFIASCRDQRIPWKATAGLHHPLRHVEPTTGTPAHGFVNLIVAAVLSQAHAPTPAQIAQILDDEQAASFVFDEDGLSWRDWRVSTEQIQRARNELLLSFGSCSFDEPREGLFELAWLKRIT